METKRTFCRICAAYCGLVADVEKGRLLEVRGDPDHALSRGYSCVKGRRIPETVNHAERLRNCLVRNAQGEFETIESRDALDEIAEKLTEIIDQHGPRAVATFTGTGAWGNGATLEIEKAWHHGIGSIMRHSAATIDQQAKMVSPWFHGLWGGGAQSFESADVILLIGQNPLVAGQYQHGGPPGYSPTALRQARQRGLKLIVVDPRQTELARQADLHLQLVPGEDPTLFAAMIRQVLDEGLEDAEFCAEHVEGIGALRSAVDDFTLDYAAERCGLPADQIREATRLFARGPRGMASTGTGPSMAPHPNLTEHLVQSLNTLCGRWGREGDPVNAPSVLTPDLPRPAQAVPGDFLPPDLSPTANTEKSRIRGLRQLFQEMPTAALAEEILTPGQGQVRALIVVGGNPVLSWPDQARTLAALEALDLLVVLDLRKTPTTRRADYVIASTHFMERAELTFLGDFFFEKPFSQFTDTVSQPAGDLIEEKDFFIELARRMGTKLELPGGLLDPENPPNTLEFFEMVRPASKVPITKIARYEGGHIFDEIELRVAPAIEGLETRLDVAPAEMISVLRNVRNERNEREDGFTHLLVCRRVKHMVNSVGHDLPRSKNEKSYNPAYLHPDDLDALALTSGDRVGISSEDGSIEAIVEAAKDVRRGVVSMTHCYGGDPAHKAEPQEVGSSVNALIAVDRNYDPICGQPRMSAIPIKLRKY
ncbi:MAG: molybdopterin-dependent oxidoreductase [bacterium]|nr:molybdopterin-dependent oxidoreductase [bacterium]